MLRSMGVCAILMTALLSGCIAVGGTSNNHPPTRGQQLVDLKLALDKGALTQAEYDQQKAQILAAKAE